MASPALRFLSPEEEERIYATSLRILAETGVVVLNGRALEFLKKAGAAVDGSTVRFSQAMVENAAAVAPRRYLMAGREERFDAWVEEGRSFMATATGTEGYLDLVSGDWRKATIADLREWAKLVDSLPNVHIICSPFPSDAPVRSREVHIAREMLQYCRKPLYLQPFTAKAVDYILRLAEAIVGGKEAFRARPLVAISSTCFSPLQFKEEDLNIMMRAGEAGSPTSVTSIAVAGASTPITIAGTLALTTAEMLAGLTIAQTANPGTPIFFTPKMMVMDMLTGMGRQGSTEGAIYSVALAQIMDRFVDIPLNLNGFAADSMVVDGQSHAERLTNCMLAALNLPAISMSAGKMEAGKTSSPLQLVLDDQSWSIISRLQRGVDTSEESIAADVIRAVGPSGEFLSQKHTLRHFKTEIATPSLFNRQSREVWTGRGGKSLEERAKERAFDLLRDYEGDTLSRETLLAMDRIVSEADRVLST